MFIYVDIHVRNLPCTAVKIGELFSHVGVEAVGFYSGSGSSETVAKLGTSRSICTELFLSCRKVALQ